MAARKALKPLWTCPKCGARLVSRNLWHSCGRFRLEALFAGADPGALKLARKIMAAVKSLGDVQCIPQKTRLVFVARVRFAGMVPRKDHVILTFALHRRLRSKRVERHIDYGPRWQAHQVRVRSTEDIDRELRGWLQESYGVVGLQSDLGAPRKQTRRSVSP